jgi:hypothetical protein
MEIWCFHQDKSIANPFVMVTMTTGLTAQTLVRSPTSVADASLPTLKVVGSNADGVIGLFNWSKPSSRTMARGSTQPLTEMSTRNLPGGKEGVRKADNLTAICEPIVWKMWEPRRLTTLWASAACYWDSFTFNSYECQIQICPLYFQDAQLQLSSVFLISSQFKFYCPQIQNVRFVPMLLCILASTVRWNLYVAIQNGFSVCLSNKEYRSSWLIDAARMRL